MDVYYVILSVLILIVCFLVLGYFILKKGGKQVRVV